MEESEGLSTGHGGRGRGRSSSGVFFFFLASGSTVSTNIEGDDYPVSTAVAGQGVSGDCLASSGVGAQSAPFGISFGTNWFDEKCRDERRAKMLEGEAKVALLCADEKTREAMLIASKVNPSNKPCPQDVLEQRKTDLKKATYWRDPKTGKVHRVAKTQIEIEGEAETVAWNSPRIGLVSAAPE